MDVIAHRRVGIVSSEKRRHFVGRCGNRLVFHFGEYPVQWGVFGRKVQRNDGIGKIVDASASRKDGIQRRRGDGRGDEFLRGQLKRKRSRDAIQGDLHARREIPRKAEPAGKAEVLEGERPPQRRHIIRAEDQPSVQRGLIPFDFEAGPFDGDLRERGTLKEGAQRGFRRERKQDMDGNGLAFQ